jgi:hypothetical protein
MSFSYRDIRDAIVSKINNDADNKFDADADSLFDVSKLDKDRALKPIYDADSFSALYHYVAKAIVEEIEGDFGQDVQIFAPTDETTPAGDETTVVFPETRLSDALYTVSNAREIIVSEPTRCEVTTRVSVLAPAEASSPLQVALKAQVHNGVEWGTLDGGVSVSTVAPDGIEHLSIPRMFTPVVENGRIRVRLEELTGNGDPTILGDTASLSVSSRS